MNKKKTTYKNSHPLCFNAWICNIRNKTNFFLTGFFLSINVNCISPFSVPTFRDLPQETLSKIADVLEEVSLFTHTVAIAARRGIYCEREIEREGEKESEKDISG